MNVQNQHPHLDKYPEAEQDSARAYELGYESKEQTEMSLQYYKDAGRIATIRDVLDKDELYSEDYIGAGFSSLALAKKYEDHANSSEIEAGEAYDKRLREAHGEQIDLKQATDAGQSIEVRKIENE